VGQKRKGATGMSLFTLRDVWSFPPSEPGTGSFSYKSLSIANIDNCPDGEEKLIMGSDGGVLRILGPPLSASPTPAEPNSSNSAEGRGSLLAEFHLGGPILQVSVGTFLG